MTLPISIQRERAEIKYRSLRRNHKPSRRAWRDLNDLTNRCLRLELRNLSKTVKQGDLFRRAA